MPTSTKTRTRKQVSRRVRLYDGCPMLLEMTVGPLSFSYWLSPMPADFGLAFEVRKMIGDGGDAYHAHIDTDDGHHSCTCKGNTFCGHCKHVEAILALLKSGRIAAPARKPAPAAVPCEPDTL